MTQIKKLSDKALRVYRAMRNLQEEQADLGPTLQQVAERAGFDNRGSVAYHLPTLIELGFVVDTGADSHKYVAVAIENIKPPEDEDE